MVVAVQAEWIIISAHKLFFTELFPTATAQKALFMPWLATKHYPTWSNHLANDHKKGNDCGSYYNSDVLWFSSVPTSGTLGYSITLCQNVFSLWFFWIYIRNKRLQGLNRTGDKYPNFSPAVEQKGSRAIMNSGRWKRNRPLIPLLIFLFLVGFQRSVFRANIFSMLCSYVYV